MRKCKTCGLPLWIAWFIMGGFSKRAVRFSEGNDCVDFLSIRTMEKIKREVEGELKEEQ